MNTSPTKIRYFSNNDIYKIPQLEKLSRQQIFDMYVVSLVFPFRVNSFVIENLIDWDNLPDDPVFRLTFMHPDMLDYSQFLRLADAVKEKKPKNEIDKIVSEIRFELNPHPAGQLTSNVPTFEGDKVKGLQHKYRETCLVFPANGQTCHSFCTFCFRWPQFTGMTDLKFTTENSNLWLQYIKVHKEITNVLFTGGDPMVMNVKNLEQYILPLLNPDFEHIKFIRIGTKSLTYNPLRYISEKDSDDVIRLFEKVNKSGKHLAIMAHFNHPNEMKPDVTKEAIKRIIDTGSTIRTQSPLLNHINKNAKIWETMWREQVRLGMIPYYMFVERDTGAHEYFAVPLWEAYKIFRSAFARVGGLARTVRGPSMSATPGKVLIEGISTINNKKVFVLNLIQARNPEWTKKPFFAEYNEEATWLHQLKPAFGEKKFFFEEELDLLIKRSMRKESFSFAGYVD